MGDPTRYVFKDLNGYSLVMDLHSDGHRKFQGSSDDIAHMSTYELTKEVLPAAKIEYSGLYKINSTIYDRDNNRVAPKNMAQHPVAGLEKKYIEAVDVLTREGLGPSIEEGMLPLTRIFGRNEPLKPDEELALQGIYDGVPFFYEVRDKSRGRELIELKFDNALRSVGFVDSKAQKLEGGGTGWKTQL